MSNYGRALPVQGRRSASVNGARYACSLCRIDYEVATGRKATCPMCEMKKEMGALREQIQTMAQEQYLLKDDLRRAEMRSNLTETLREGLDLAEFEDLAMIKAIAYRWRADPDNFEVRALLLQGRAALEVCASGGAVEFFVPTSVGGVVFVETYMALVNAQGRLKAMERYAQAIAAKLAP